MMVQHRTTLSSSMPDGRRIQSAASDEEHAIHLLVRWTSVLPSWRWPMNRALTRSEWWSTKV